MGHLVIIGNGISGITAARHVRKRSDERITVISGESDHFFSRTALMYVYMGHMRYQDIKPYPDDFWAKNRIDLLRAWVERVDTDERRVLLANGNTLAYDRLVIATGSVPNRSGWPGEELPGVQGLYSLQDLEAMALNTKGVSRAVVVGGGLIGVEMAEMLRSRGVAVTILVREEGFWGNVLPREEADLIARHLREHGVDLRLRTELAEVLPGTDGRVRAIRTKAGEEIPCGFVGLTIGVRPNIDWLRNSPGIPTDRGVLVNEFLETGVSGIHAIGDCAQFRTHPDPTRRPIEQVWYTGRRMGGTVARTLTGDRTAYAPGHWFNSAKFFDIEYQTYGRVSARAKEDEARHYWEHPKGRVALHLAWNRNDRRFIGVNGFGLRLRHDVFDRWLTERTPIDQVVAKLEQAAFDPEFTESHAPAVRASFVRVNAPAA